MKKILFWVVGIAILIQFIRPDFTNAKVDDAVALNANQEVLSVLKTSCYDCHSHETKYPWYYNVAPLSWMMSSNIDAGRQALDFSNWENIDTEVRLERLKRAKKLVNNEMMPKSEYLMMHKNAVLDKEKKETLEQFFDSQIKELSSIQMTNS